MKTSYLSITFAAAALTLSGGAFAEDDERSGAMEDVQESVEVVQQMMRQDDELGRGLDAAKALFVIPDYATAALIVGGTGGEGVLFSREAGEFANPVFYDVGSLSIGAQAGVSAGSLVYLLMSDEAVESFKQENNFSLNAEAGVTIINWSAEAEWSGGKGDVVVWSDTEGLLAEVALGVSDINFDEEETASYYNQAATPQQILAGQVENPHASELRSEFAAFTGAATGAAATQDPQRQPMEETNVADDEAEYDFDGSTAADEGAFDSDDAAEQDDY